MKKRLDQLVVERGLAGSKEKAQAMIMAGQVFVDGQKAAKPGHSVDAEAAIEAVGTAKFVGRGGVKLEGALEHFHIDVLGKICLDVGSSTGGFTDCLLQRGAAKVYAIDAGTAQLDWKLRQDARVVVHENTNARFLDASTVPEPVAFACFDLSFISVTKVLPAVVPLLDAAAPMVILVKPQFEVDRGEVGKGGIVRDPALHQKACDRIRAAVDTFGFGADIIESPITGTEGNREFLLYAQRR
jgi:23S rRNA (cytidine1920-2'-O)/16S rRNA (cytidine1409-2'-O)-methyltransferase